MVGCKLSTFYSKNDRRRVIASPHGWMSVYCRLLVIFPLPLPPLLPPRKLVKFPLLLAVTCLYSWVVRRTAIVKCHTREYRRATWPRIGSWTFLAALQCTVHMTTIPPNHYYWMIYWQLLLLWIFFLYSGLCTFPCRTLAQYLSRLEKDLEEREILLIFQQMLSALKYIHVNNILHRCKSDTILNTCIIPMHLMYAFQLFFYEHVTSEGDYIL